MIYVFILFSDQLCISRCWVTSTATRLCSAFPLATPCSHLSSPAAAGGGVVLSLTRHLETSLVTPMSLSRDWWPLPGHVTQLPHLSYSPESDYSSSAVLALALDTATLQYRRRHGQLTAHDVAPGLVTNGRRVATIGLDMPMQMSHSPTEYFESSLLSHLTPLARVTRVQWLQHRPRHPAPPSSVSEA